MFNVYFYVFVDQIHKRSMYYCLIDESKYFGLILYLCF
jgi:hypothetical protein